MVLSISLITIFSNFFNKFFQMERHENEDRDANEVTGEADDGMNFSGSEEMNLGIARILEKVERFNQLVLSPLRIYSVHSLHGCCIYLGFPSSHEQIICFPI